ncbi:type IV toxin-antitoxin system AbiEi family antitoxin domain-containing protein [Microcella humidisoli]|uniref:type IV toxin-antitoxin system AbiEi family antitoxin domain-containing protein n=1 Tax=Microcella humidisoli TaxID=2963406 RepID=UPI0020CEA154|nr:type IV toxin-antitoxin system AbiEi family antitoxin domain-containing protein [Microcella humidisoli]
MHSFTAALRAHGGVARAADLAHDQSGQRALRRAHSRGELSRLRRGVYALPELDADIRLAAAVGGRIAGVSALRHHGLWAPPGARSPLHVEVADDVQERPAEAQGRTVLIHWLPAGSRPRFGVAPLEAALARAANDLPLPFAVAVLDSALRAAPLTPVELQFLAAGWRPQARAAAALADERSESGTESVLRVLLREAGIQATPQASLPIGDFARADLLVGDRLLIECDSEAHHAEPANRRADLRRDESLMALGFIVLRPDYRQVFDDPAGIVATVAAIVARGDHLSARPGV